jgi:FkbM family methyltransferase
MRIGNRTIHLSQIKKKLFPFLKILLNIWKLKNPLSLIGHYLNLTSPHLVQFRNGLIVHTSKHPHDLISLFVVFLHKDYGNVKKGDIIVDIGANIGSFSLYAAQQGASKVYAYEPCEEAYHTLCKNIKSNDLESIIIPFNCALGGNSGKEWFSIHSSPYNKLHTTNITDSPELKEIPVITLNTAITTNNIQHIDILKIDCEGAEFDIIPSINQEQLKKIQSICLEYHNDPKSRIINYLELNRFILEYQEKYNINVGILRMKKEKID